MNSALRFIAVVVAAVVTVTLVGVTVANAETERTKDAICHPVGGANGGNTGVGYSIISPDKASSHIDEETGAPKHEHDGRVDVLLGDDLLCPGEGEQELTIYRVVAGMPRYRGDKFSSVGEPDCSITTTATTWTSTCGDQVDTGRLASRTYVRLREIGVPGPAQVLLDLR